MQSGVITPENLGQVLRELSQKRKSGVLGITVGECQWQLKFVRGRVVDMLNGSEPPLTGLAQRLQRAGYIEGDVGEFLSTLPASLEGERYQTLYHVLNMDQEAFKLAVKHQVLDALYTLDLQQGAYYSFKMQMVEFDKEYCPSLSVGQLLLDLVELPVELERYTSTFSDDDFIVRTPGDPAPLSAEEQAVFDLIEKASSLDELFAQSMLSQFHFLEAVLALYDQGAVAITDSESTHSAGSDESGTQGGVDLSMVDDLVAALEDSIDSSFEEALAESDDHENVEERSEVTPDLKLVKTSAPLVEAGSTAGVADHEDEQILIDEVSAEEFDEDVQISFRNRTDLLNMRLLHSQLVPLLVLSVFMMVAFLAPLFYWGRLISLFAD